MLRSQAPVKRARPTANAAPRHRVTASLTLPRPTHIEHCQGRVKLALVLSNDSFVTFRSAGYVFWPGSAGVERAASCPPDPSPCRRRRAAGPCRAAIWSSICLLAAFCFSICSSSAFTCAASGPGGAGGAGGAGKLDGHVHDRTVEQVPAEAEAGGDQQEATHQPAQDQGPARAAAFGRRTVGERVGHDASEAPVERSQSIPADAAEWGCN